MDRADRIADAWITLHSLPENSAEREKNFWAFEHLSELCRNDPEAALYLLGRYQEAVETALQCRGLRRFSTADRVLAASYAQLGMQAEAAVCAMLAESSTETTIADAIRPFKRTADREHYAGGLRKAGLPAG